MPYNITYMWNLKYDTNKHIYETERDLWLTRGREDEGEINREFGVSRRKLLYVGGITTRSYCIAQRTTFNIL